MKIKPKNSLSESDKQRALELFDQGYGYGRIAIALQAKSPVVDAFIRLHRNVSARKKRLPNSVKAPPLV
jgi:hypothetical protein